MATLNPLNAARNALQAAPNAPATASGGAGAPDGGVTEIPLLDGQWIAEFEDTSWIAEIGRAVQTAPLNFFGGLFLDASLGFLLFGVLWFLVERWAHDTRAAILRRELWEDEQKQGELERTTLLPALLHLVCGLFRFRPDARALFAPLPCAGTAVAGPDRAGVARRGRAGPHHRRLPSSA